MADFKKYTIPVGMEFSKSDRAKIKAEVRNAIDDIKNEASKIEKGFVVDDSGLKSALDVLRGMFDELQQHKTSKGNALTDLANEGKGLYKDFVAMQSSIAKLATDIYGLTEPIKELTESFKPFADMLQTKHPVFFHDINAGATQASDSIERMAKIIAGVDNAPALNATLSALRQIKKEAKNAEYTIKIDYDADVDTIRKILDPENERSKTKFDDMLSFKFSSLREEYDEITDSMKAYKEGQVEYVNGMSKLVPVLNEMIAVNERYRKSFGGTLFDEDDIVSDANAARDQVKDIMQELNEQIMVAKRALSRAVSDLMTDLGTVNVKLALSTNDKQDFINVINKYVTEINTGQYGDLNKIDLAFNINNEEKLPKTKKGMQSYLEKYQGTIDSINETISKSEERIAKLNGDLEQYQADAAKPINKGNDVLTGKINKTTKEIEQLTSTLESQRVLLTAMGNIDEMAAVSSGWKRFDKMRKAIAGSQAQILSDTLRWRGDMNDALTFYYSWKGDKADEEAERVFSALDAKAAAHPIQLVPDIDGFVGQIEDALRDHIFNINIASDSPIVVNGIIANGGGRGMPMGGGVTPTTRVPSTPTNVSPPSSDTLDDAGEKIDIAVNANTNTIIKFAEEQVRLHNELQEKINAELKRLGIQKKQLSSTIESMASNEEIWETLKESSVSSIKEQYTAGRVGSQKDKVFLGSMLESHREKKIDDATLKQKIAERYQEKHNYLHNLTKLFEQDKQENKFIVTQSAEILKIRDRMSATTDSTEVERLSAQISQTLVDAIANAFRQYIEKSDATIDKANKEIVSLSKKKEEAVAAHKQHPEVQKQIAEAASLRGQIEDLESDSDVSNYSKLLQKILNLQHSKRTINQEELDTLVHQRDSTDEGIKVRFEQLKALRQQLHAKIEQNQVIADIVEYDERIAKAEKTRKNAQLRQAAYASVPVSLEDYVKNGEPKQGVRSLLASGDAQAIADFIVKKIISVSDITERMRPGVTETTGDRTPLFSTVPQQNITDTIRLVQYALGYDRKSRQEENDRISVEQLLKEVVRLTNQGQAVYNVRNSTTLSEGDFARLRAEFAHESEPTGKLKEFIDLLAGIKAEKGQQNPDSKKLLQLVGRAKSMRGSVENSYKRYVRFQEFGRATNEYENASKEFNKNLQEMGNGEDFQKASDKVKYFTEQIVSAYKALPNGSDIKNKIDVALGITKDSNIAEILTANYDEIKKKLVSSVGPEDKSIAPLISTLKQLSKWRIFTDKQQLFNQSLQGVKPDREHNIEGVDSINGEILKMLKSYSFIIKWIDEQGEHRTTGYNAREDENVFYGATKVNPGYQKAAEFLQYISDNWDKIENIQMLKSPNTATFGIGAGKVIRGGARPSEITTPQQPKAEREYDFSARESAAKTKRDLVTNPDYDKGIQQRLDQVASDLATVDQTISELDASLEVLQKSAEVAKSRLDELGAKPNLPANQVINEVIKKVDEYEAAGKSDELLRSNIEDLLQLPYDRSSVDPQTLQRFQDIRSTYSIEGRIDAQNKAIWADADESYRRQVEIVEELKTARDEERELLEREQEQIAQRTAQLAATKIVAIRATREQAYENLSDSLDYTRVQKQVAVRQKNQLEHQQEVQLSQEQLDLQARIAALETERHTASAERLKILEAELATSTKRYEALETVAQRLEKIKMGSATPKYSAEAITSAQQTYNFEVIDAAADNIEIADAKITKLQALLEQQQKNLKYLQYSGNVYAKQQAYSSYLNSAIFDYKNTNPAAYADIYAEMLKEVQAERGHATDDKELRAQTHEIDKRVRDAIQKRIEAPDASSVNGVSRADIIQQAITNVQRVITETGDLIEAAKAKKVEFQGHLDKAKQEGKITDEMIAARKGLVKETEQEATATRTNTEAVRTESQAHKSIQQSNSGIQYVDYSGESYGGVYGIDTSDLAKESTLQAIYALLGGKPIARSILSDTERKALEDERASLQKDLGVGRNKKDDDLDIHPNLLIASELQEAITKKIGIAVSDADIQGIVKNIAVKLLEQSGDLSADRDTFYKQNHDVIYKASYDAVMEAIFDDIPDISSILPVDSTAELIRKSSAVDDALQTLGNALSTLDLRKVSSLKPFFESLGREVFDAEKLLRDSKYKEAIDLAYEADFEKELPNVVALLGKMDKLRAKVQPIVPPKAIEKSVEENTGGKPVEVPVQPVVDKSSIDSFVDKFVKSEPRATSSSLAERKTQTSQIGYNYGSYITEGHRRDDWQNVNSTISGLDSTTSTIIYDASRDALKGDSSRVAEMLDVLDIVEKKLLELDDFLEKTKNNNIKNKKAGREGVLTQRNAALDRISEAKTLLGAMSNPESQQYLTTELNKYMPKYASRISEDYMKDLMKYDLGDLQKIDWGFGKKKIDWKNVFAILSDMMDNFTEVESGALYGAKIGDTDVVRHAMEYLNLVSKAIALLDTELAKQPKDIKTIEIGAKRDDVVGRGKYLKARLGGFLPDETIAPSQSAPQENGMTYQQAIKLIGDAISSSKATTEKGQAKVYAEKVLGDAKVIEAAKFIKGSGQIPTEAKALWDKLVQFGASYKNVNQQTPAAIEPPKEEPTTQTPPDDKANVRAQILALLPSVRDEINAIRTELGSLKSDDVKAPEVTKKLEALEEKERKLTEALEEPKKEKPKIKTETPLEQKPTPKVEPQPNASARIAEIEAKLAADDLARTTSIDGTDGGLIGIIRTELAKEVTLNKVLESINIITRRNASTKSNGAADLYESFRRMLESDQMEGTERVRYMDYATGAMSNHITGTADGVLANSLDKLYQNYIHTMDINTQVHTHAGTNDPYFSPKDLARFAGDRTDKNITKQVLLSDKNITLLDLSEVEKNNIQPLLDELSATEHSFEKLNEIAQKYGARYATMGFGDFAQDITPQALINFLGIKGVESKYSESETQEAAREGVAAEVAKESAEMVQESTGQAVKTTFQKYGVELEKLIERTDKEGNKTWSSQTGNKVEKNLAKLKEEMFRELEVGTTGTSNQFGVDTSASQTLTDYIDKYNKLMSLVKDFNKKGSDKPSLQIQIDKLLPDLKDAGKELDGLIARKEKFMGKGEYLGTLSASDMSTESLVDIAKKQFFPDGLTVGQNIATAGVQGTQNGKQLLVDLLNNGSIARYALEVDETTGQVRKLLVAESDLANAFQNVNKAMRQNENVLANLGGLDIKTEEQLQSFLSTAHSPELDAYNAALKEMQQYTANLWNTMKGGESASEEQLNYLMMLSERAFVLGKNIQKTSIDFKNFWAQNPDKITALNINTRNADGSMIENRDKIVAAQMKNLASSQARANNERFDFVGFDNNTLKYTLTDVEGNVRKVSMVWDELYQKVATVNDKTVAGLDTVVAKIQKYEQSMQDALSSGYLDSSDGALQKFNDVQAKIQAIVRDVKDGNTTYEAQANRLDALRQKAIEYGDAVKKNIAKNQRAYTGTNEVNAAKRQYSKSQGIFGFGETDNPDILQNYINAYNALIQRHKEYADANKLSDPQVQENLRQQAAQVQSLGRAYNNAAKEQQKLEEDYQRSFEQSFTDKKGNTVHLGGKQDIDDTTNLRAQMEEYASTLGHVNLENVKFSATKQQMTYTIRMNNKEAADMVIKYNEAGKALYAYNTAQRESLSGLQLLWSETKKKFKQILQYTASMTSLYRLWSMLKQGVQYVKEIDLALTELKKVTNETEETYDRFLETAGKAAARIGSTLKDFTQATADFARLGYNIKQASEMAEAALVYKNVGDGINSVQEASESIISTLKAFNMTASDSMNIVSKFNEVGNNFAITSKGIGDALQNSASALEAAGNSLDESIGLITGANTVVNLCHAA